MSVGFEGTTQNSFGSQSAETPLDTLRTPPAQVILPEPLIRSLATLRLPVGVRAKLLHPEVEEAYSFRIYCQRLYAALHNEHALEALFLSIPGDPTPTFATFEAFLAHSCAVVIEYAKPECPHWLADIAGLVWLTDIIPHEQGQVGGWYRRRYWRRVQPRVVSQTLLAWAFQTFSFERLWARTSTDAAVKHWQACGGQRWPTEADTHWDKTKEAGITYLQMIPAARAVRKRMPRRVPKPTQERSYAGGRHG